MRLKNKMKLKFYFTSLSNLDFYPFCYGGKLLSRVFVELMFIRMGPFLWPCIHLHLAFVKNLIFT